MGVPRVSMPDRFSDEPRQQQGEQQTIDSHGRHLSWSTNAVSAIPNQRRQAHFFIGFPGLFLLPGFF